MGKTVIDAWHGGGRALAVQCDSLYECRIQGTKPACERWLEYDPIVLAASLGLVVCVYNDFHPGLLVRGRRSYFVQ